MTILAPVSSGRSLLLSSALTNDDSPFGMSALGAEIDDQDSIAVRNKLKEDILELVKCTPSGINKNTEKSEMGI